MRGRRHRHRVIGCRDASGADDRGQEGVSWEDWLALARACEEHGIEALFRSDHYLSQTDGARPAGRLGRDPGARGPDNAARVGTLVSPVTFRAAAVLANVSATANEIAAGRVSLGMGTGWMEAEHEAFGFPFPEMKTRLGWLAEQLEAVRASGATGFGRTSSSAAAGSPARSTRPRVGRRVQHDLRDAGGVRRARREARTRLRARGSRPDPALADDRLRDRADARRGARADPPPARARRAGSTPTSTGGSAARPRCSAHSTRRPSSCGLRAGGCRAGDAAASRPPRPRAGGADRPRARADGRLALPVCRRVRPRGRLQGFRASRIRASGSATCAARPARSRAQWSTSSR